jgi:uncharacterized protein
MPAPLALVTGASSGLGAVFARKLAAQHYDLLLVGRRLERLEGLAAELASGHGIRAEPFSADLASSDGIDRTAARIESDERLTLLVNNAGFGSKGRFWDVPLETHVRMHRLHIMATMRLCYAALPGMIRRDNGAIVNVSSVAAFARSPGNASYGPTKTWMNAFTEALYLELKSIRSEVRVQALCPGFTVTEFHDVMGVDRRNLSKSWWFRADDVVAASLGALQKDRLFVIPGLRYRLIAALMTKLPAGLRIAIERRSPQSRGRV